LRDIVLTRRANSRTPLLWNDLLWNDLSSGP
jgi:hypothetical protein